MVGREEIEGVTVDRHLELVGAVDRAEAGHTTEMARRLVGDDQRFPDLGTGTGADGVAYGIAGHLVEGPVGRHQDGAQSWDLGGRDDRLWRRSACDGGCSE
jgi:hypothetical protein